MYCFTSHLRIFHSFKNITSCRWSVTNVDQCFTLTDIAVIIVPTIIRVWYLSFYKVISQKHITVILFLMLKEQSIGMLNVLGLVKYWYGQLNLRPPVYKASTQTTCLLWSKNLTTCKLTFLTLVALRFTQFKWKRMIWYEMY